MDAVACCDLLRYMDMPLKDEELATIIAALPRETAEAMARGEREEPMCGVCDSMAETAGLMTEPQKFIAACLAEWHDEPVRDPALLKEEGERQMYERCLAIYRGATILLEQT